MKSHDRLEHQRPLLLSPITPTHCFLLDAHLFFYLAHTTIQMEKQKRQRQPTTVETLQESGATTKHPKLVLKPPKFITARQTQHEAENISTILENVLELETAELVLEYMLELIDTCKLETVVGQQSVWSSEEVAKCISVVGKIAKAYRSDTAICCVLVHVLEILAAKLRSSSEGVLPKNLQLFALSLVDHSEESKGLIEGVN